MRAGSSSSSRRRSFRKRRSRARLFLVAGVGAVVLAAGGTAPTADLWTLPGGTAEDLSTNPTGVVSWIDVPLDSVGSDVVVSAGPGERWRLTATYLDAEPVPLAVNDRGQTYGSSGAGEEPDLVAVVATNGRQGYVDADELADATGSSLNFASPEEALRWQDERAVKVVVVPVYLSDGVTRVGDFVVQ